MARIRTIKPEFFTSEDIVALTPLARLLYIAVWCEADKEGRLQWKPKTLKMRYLPADKCDIDGLCRELINQGVVRLYGDGLAFIPSFTGHQHINPRETASKLPEPTEHDASLTRGDASILDLHAQVGREGKGREVDSCEQSFDNSQQPPDVHLSTPPPVAEIPLIDGSSYPVTSDQVEEWADAFPAVDVLQQIKAMRVWCNANPKQRKTASGVARFVTTWLTREQNRGGTRPRGGADSFLGVI